jgi:hypothetical protein
VVRPERGEEIVPREGRDFLRILSTSGPTPLTVANVPLRSLFMSDTSGQNLADQIAVLEKKTKDNSDDFLRMLGEFKALQQKVTNLEARLGKLDGSFEERGLRSKTSAK